MISHAVILRDQPREHTKLKRKLKGSAPVRPERTDATIANVAIFYYFLIPTLSLFRHIISSLFLYSLPFYSCLFLSLFLFISRPSFSPPSFSLLLSLLPFLFYYFFFFLFITFLFNRLSYFFLFLDFLFFLLFISRPSFSPPSFSLLLSLLPFLFFYRLSLLPFFLFASLPF